MLKRINDKLKRKFISQLHARGARALVVGIALAGHRLAGEASGHAQLLGTVPPADLAGQRGNVDLDVLLLVQVEFRVGEVADPHVAELVVPGRAARRGRPQEHALGFGFEVAVADGGRPRARALALRRYHGAGAGAHAERVALDARPLVRRRLRRCCETAVITL